MRRVLVFFGGTDPHNLSGRALTALSDPALGHLAVDLVIGANHPQREALVAQAAARPGTRVHGPRPHLADLMAAADLALGAGWYHHLGARLSGAAEPGGHPRREPAARLPGPGHRGTGRRPGGCPCHPGYARMHTDTYPPRPAA